MSDRPSTPAARWRRPDYAVDAETLARRLIGQLLVRILEDGRRLSGMIVETEAYLGRSDEGAHSFGGRRTQRNESMYGPPGLCYVYFTYGMHHCVNVVAGKREEPVAALIRALAPVEGIPLMRAARSASRRKSPLQERDLCSGPGKLCQAMQIDRGLDGRDLATDEEIFIERGVEQIDEADLSRSARIGLGCGPPWSNAPLRWTLKGNRHLSRP